MKDKTFQAFYSCCRSVLSDDVFKMKKKYIKKYGGTYKDYEVHHYVTPFMDIVNGFIKDNSIDINNVPFLCNVEEYHPDFRFYRKGDIQKFKTYHNKIAQMKVIPIEEHKFLHSKKKKVLQKAHMEDLMIEVKSPRMSQREKRIARHLKKEANKTPAEIYEEIVEEQQIALNLYNTYKKISLGKLKIELNYFNINVVWDFQECMYENLGVYLEETKIKEMIDYINTLDFVGI